MQACPAPRTADPLPADQAPPSGRAPQPSCPPTPAIAAIVIATSPGRDQGIVAPTTARTSASTTEQAAISGLELLPTPVHEFILDLLPPRSRLCLERQVSKSLQTRLEHRARQDMALQRAATVWTEDELAAALSDESARPFSMLAPASRAAVLVALIHRLPGLPKSSHEAGFRLLLDHALQLPAPLRAAPLNALARCIRERAAVVDPGTLLDTAGRIAAEPLAPSARLRCAALSLLKPGALSPETRAQWHGIADQLLPDAPAALALARAFPAAEQAEALSIGTTVLARLCPHGPDAAAPWRALLEAVARDETDAVHRGRLIAELAKFLPGLEGVHAIFGVDAATASQHATLLLDTVFSLPGDGPFHALGCLLGTGACAGPFQYVRQTQRLELVREIAQRTRDAALTPPQRLHLSAALLRFMPDPATWDALWSAAVGGTHAETLVLLSTILPRCQSPAPDSARVLAVLTAARDTPELPPSARSALLKVALYYGREAINAAGLTESTLACVAALARDHGEYGPLVDWAQPNQPASRHRVVDIIQSLAPMQQVRAVRQWLYDGKWPDLGHFIDLSALARQLAQTGHLVELAGLASAICNRCAQWMGQGGGQPALRERIETAGRILADDWIGLLEANAQSRSPAAIAASALLAHQLDALTDSDAALVLRAWALIEQLDADDLRACLDDLRPFRRLEKRHTPATGVQDRWPRSAVARAAEIARTRLSSPERREWLAHLLGRQLVQKSMQASAQEADLRGTREKGFDKARQATWDLAMSLPPAQWSYAASFLAQWFASPPDAPQQRAPWEQAKRRFHECFGG